MFPLADMVDSFQWLDVDLSSFWPGKREVVVEIYKSYLTHAKKLE